MDPVELHLALNHIPVVATGLAVLIMLAAVGLRTEDAFKVGLAIFVGSAVVVIFVYLTGERSEDLVEDLPWFVESIVERHEDAGKVATWATGALGVLGLVGLVAYRASRIPGWFRALAILAGFAVSGLLVWAAALGGEIRHDEIRDEATPVLEEESRESPDVSRDDDGDESRSESDSEDET